MPHKEHHRQHRVGWLRATVLGANDGIVSTSSLIIGVAAANSSHTAIIVAGTAGLVAGAVSMAAGEYVSVCSQSDTENYDLQIEQQALEDDYEAEVTELSEIYQERGVEPVLALEVAKQLMAHDAIGAHARDEIGISEETQAKPVVAALSSAASFSVGALFPLVTAYIYTGAHLIWVIAGCSIVFLIGLGAMSAHLSGAKIHTGILRVTIWGALAMAVTALVGIAFDTAV